MWLITQLVNQRKTRKFSRNVSLVNMKELQMMSFFMIELLLSVFLVLFSARWFIFAWKGRGFGFSSFFFFFRESAPLIRRDVYGTTIASLLKQGHCLPSRALGEIKVLEKKVDKTVVFFILKMAAFQFYPVSNFLPTFFFKERFQLVLLRFWKPKTCLDLIQCMLNLILPSFTVKYLKTANVSK